MVSLLASVRLWSGHVDAAAALAEQARVTFKKLGDAFGLTQSLTVLGRSQVALGDPNAARTSESLVAQAEMQTQAAFPYIAAAGIAMHAGDGKTALLYANEALDRLVVVQANGGEALIIKAVGLAQIGEYDAARTALADVPDDGRSNPFYLSVVALVASLERAADEAVAAAQGVVDAAGHSYLDGVVASMAAGASAAGNGDAVTAERWLDDSVGQAGATQDVVATALSLAAYEHVLGRDHPSGPARLDALGVGWRSVVDALPRLVDVG